MRVFVTPGITMMATNIPSRDLLAQKSTMRAPEKCVKSVQS